MHISNATFSIWITLELETTLYSLIPEGHTDFRDCQEISKKFMIRLCPGNGLKCYGLCNLVWVCDKIELGVL